MQFELQMMTLNDYCIEEEETNSNRMKSHWKTIAKTCKTIAKFWVLLQLNFQIVPKKERKTIAKSFELHN